MSTPHFLPLLDPTAALLLPSLALLGPVLIPSSLLAAILPTLPPTASYYVEASESTDDIVALLNDGASRVIVTPDQVRELVGSIEKDRLILRVQEQELAEHKDHALSASGLYLISNNLHTPESLGLTNTDIYLVPSKPSPSELSELMRSSRPSTYVLPTSILTTGTTSATHLSIADAFLAPIISDRPDSLFPTVVSSYTHSSQPLGLVYSSRERASARLSRHVKVSTSHENMDSGVKVRRVVLYREVTSIRADCDSDALLFEVVQYGGGFCHLPQPTCFGTTFGIAKLEETLKSRYQSAPEGSYTKRLFDDEKLLRSKIMEEAEELCDAQTKEEVAFEAADLVYFAMTRCISKGVGWRDVEAALDRKSLKVTRRKGDAKPKWDQNVKP